MIKKKYITLKNGLKLILVSDKSKHSTYAEINVEFGGMTKKFEYNNKVYELPDGVAHLLEHTIFESNIYGNISEYYKDKYVESNAYTSPKKTCFHIDTVFDFYEHLVELIKIVNIPAFTKEKLETIKLPVIEEIKAKNDNPYKLFDNAGYDCLLTTRTYHDNVGSVDTITNMEYDLLKTVYDVFYQPSNQYICVCGNFDIKKVIKLIEDTYAEIRREPVEYKLLDENETIEVNKKEEHVIKEDVDEIVLYKFKIDVSDYDRNRKNKLMFYLAHYLSYSFNDESEAFKKVIDNNYSVYSINHSTSDLLDDLLIINLSLTTTKEKEFEKLIFDTLGNIKFDKEMFDIWKNKCIINYLVKSDQLSFILNNYYENITEYDYDGLDTLEEVEELNIEECKKMIKELDFSNYCKIVQTKE